MKQGINLKYLKNYGRDEKVFSKETHLGVSELLPELVADLALLGAPHQHPIDLIGAMGVGPTAQVTARVLQVGPTPVHMAAHL